MKDKIKIIVEREFGTDNFIVDHNKDKEAIARHVYVHLLILHTNLSMDEIAEIIRRHRTTVYASLKASLSLLDDSRYRKKILFCESKCKNLFGGVKNNI